MHGHAAGLARERHRLLQMKIGIVRIDGAAEHAILVVVAEDGPLWEPGNDLQRTVGEIHVLQHQAAGEDVVVGVGIEGPVLVPLHRRAAAGRLGVELGRCSSTSGPSSCFSTMVMPEFFATSQK